MLAIHRYGVNIHTTDQMRKRLVECLLTSVSSLLVVLWVEMHLCRAGPSSESDRAALLEFFDLTNGLEWSDSTHWGTDVDIMFWRGVGVDGEGRVDVLDLYDKSVSGECTTLIFYFSYVPRITRPLFFRVLSSFFVGMYSVSTASAGQPRLTERLSPPSLGRVVLFCCYILLSCLPLYLCYLFESRALRTGFI